MDVTDEIKLEIADSVYQTLLDNESIPTQDNINEAISELESKIMDPESSDSDIAA
jgi:hypothetical protein